MAFRADDWLVGNRGAEGVDRRLRRLGASWRILDRIPHGSGIRSRHLVFGPPGTFVLDVEKPALRPFARRRSPRSLTPLVPSVVQDARVVERVLARAWGRDAAVWPVTVTLSNELEVREQGLGVYVVAERLLVPWLKSLMEKLTGEDVAVLYALARESGTWMSAFPG